LSLNALENKDISNVENSEDTKDNSKGVSNENELIINKEDTDKNVSQSLSDLSSENSDNQAEIDSKEEEDENLYLNKVLSKEKILLRHSDSVDVLPDGMTLEKYKSNILARAKKRRLMDPSMVPFITPVRIKQFNILDWGEILFNERDEYFRRRKSQKLHPIPINYTIESKMLQHVVILEIIEGIEGPIYRLIDENGLICEGSTATGPCRTWLNVHRKQYSKSGPEAYGFDNEVIQHVLNQLPVTSPNPQRSFKLHQAKLEEEAQKRFLVQKRKREKEAEAEQDRLEDISRAIKVLKPNPETENKTIPNQTPFEAPSNPLIWHVPMPQPGDEQLQSVPAQYIQDPLNQFSNLSTDQNDHETNKII